MKRPVAYFASTGRGVPATVFTNADFAKVGIETSSLAPFSGIAGRNLNGALKLDARGTISPLIGGFNLNLDGTAEGLALSEPALDKVLAGTVKLNGRVARTEKGLEAEGF